MTKPVVPVSMETFFGMKSTTHPNNTPDEIAAAYRLCPEDVREILGMTQ